MFDIKWFWLYWLVSWHLSAIAWSLYMHRGKTHDMLELSTSLDHTLRFILWANGAHPGPKGVENYTYRHLRHHHLSDTIDDPQSPYYLSLKQMCNLPPATDEQLKIFKHAKSPDDWIEKNLYLKYQKSGQWVKHILSGVLFGIWGTVISWVISKILHSWWNVFWINFALHKIGFSYAGNRKHDRSKILFPIGIILAGEELHANHHNHPRNPNFRVRWFELDIGYLYAKIFNWCGLLKFKKSRVGT